MAKADFEARGAISFDQIIDRRNTNALAQEGYEGYLFDGDELNLTCVQDDLIHMWVADMALAAPQAAIDAMAERLQHPIFGYTCHFDDVYYDAFRSWTEKRHGWTFPREQLVISSGVIPALYKLVEMFCCAGEKVLTLSPAYGFFKHATVSGGAVLETSPIKEVDGRHEVDVEDLRLKASDPATKLMFLCHPHNPTGRVWTENELRQIAEICFENDVVIVSDEVHCDLLRKDCSHIPLAKLYPESKSIVTCMAPSKTFNLAGLQLASVIIPDADTREKWMRDSLPFLNPISFAGACGAYRGGEMWLEDLRSHLDTNFEILSAFLDEHLPSARFQIPEATYLAWIDLSAYFPEPINLTRFFAEKAGVVLEGGEMFVADGGQCIRLNIACPADVVERALMRMADAVNSKRVN